MKDIIKTIALLCLIYFYYYVIVSLISCDSTERDSLCEERNVFYNLMIDRTIEEQPEREEELEIKRDSLLAIPCK